MACPPTYSLVRQKSIAMKMIVVAAMNEEKPTPTSLFAALKGKERKPHGEWYACVEHNAGYMQPEYIKWKREATNTSSAYYR